MALTNTAGRLAQLEALRETLAAAIDSCDGTRDMAPLAGRYMDCLREIDALKAAQPAKEGTALDELDRRRRSRGAAATG